MVRSLLGMLALVAGIALVLPVGAARASVSLAATWDGLLGESSAAALLTPTDAQAAWENGRIYTYTHLHVDRAVAGDLPAGSSIWVRTMGGVVGKIGQIVEGEAVFAPGRASLVFLHPGPAGSFEVTARGQGQFPVVSDSTHPAPRLIRSGGAGAILPRNDAPGARLAGEAMHGRLIEDVALEVAADWERTHKER